MNRCNEQSYLQARNGKWLCNNKGYYEYCKYTAGLVFAAQCNQYASAAAIRCLSVRPSVTFVYSVETNKHIFKTFAPLGSHIILVLRISPLTASNKCHNLSLSGGAVLITPRRSQRWQHATKPDTGRKSRFLPIPPAFSASVRWSPSEYCHDFWYEKLEWWKKI